MPPGRAAGRLLSVEKSTPSTIGKGDGDLTVRERGAGAGDEGAGHLGLAGRDDQRVLGRDQREVVGVDQLDEVGAFLAATGWRS